MIKLVSRKLPAALLILGLMSATGQTITGSIVGSVTDSSGSAISSAGITLVNPATGVERKTQTATTGDFAFSALQPGAYNVTVVSPGFKRLERTSINLTASETLSLGTLSLGTGHGGADGQHGALRRADGRPG